VTEEFAARLSGLLERSRPTLGRQHRLTFGSVFGASGAYVDGHIFASSGGFGVALKLPPPTRTALLGEDGAVPLRYFPKGHIKRESVVLPTRILEDRERFGELVDASVAYVLG